MRRFGSPCLFCFVLATLSTFPPAANSQAGKRLSAREIFYSAPGEPPAAKKAASAPKALPTPAGPQQTAKTRKKTATETASAKTARPAKLSPEPAGGLSAAPEGAAYVPVSYVAGASFPLGVRYSILKKESAEVVEANPDAVFRSGDRIRLRVEVNDTGYLYIIHRGSSGAWKPLFPSAEIAEGDNRVRKGKPYDIPSGYVFTFDEQPGEEKLFIVFSRQPESDLEGLIYSLSGGQKPAEPAAPSSAKILLAQNMVNIKEGVIDNLRAVYSRDLIVEKVDEATPGPAREKAVYVVNPSRSGDSRVVADVTLNHQ